MKKQHSPRTIGNGRARGLTTSQSDLPHSTGPVPAQRQRVLWTAQACLRFTGVSLLTAPTHSPSDDRTERPLRSTPGSKLPSTKRQQATALHRAGNLAKVACALDCASSLALYRSELAHGANPQPLGRAVGAKPTTINAGEQAPLNKAAASYRTP